jgi:hypothetical protein
LAKLLRTLQALRRTRQRPWKRDTLLHKLGAAHQAAGKAWRFVKITVPAARQPVNRHTFQFELLKDVLLRQRCVSARRGRRRVCGSDPALNRS